MLPSQLGASVVTVSSGWGSHPGSVPPGPAYAWTYPALSLKPPAVICHLWKTKEYWGQSNTVVSASFLRRFPFEIGSIQCSQIIPHKWSENNTALQHTGRMASTGNTGAEPRLPPCCLHGYYQFMSCNQSLILYFSDCIHNARRERWRFKCSLKKNLIRHWLLREV